jgi:large subunit ribosomal protein L20
MSKVKRSLMANKRRKALLARAKGFKGKSGNIYRIAKERLLKAESNAYKSRKLRKGDFRSLWIVRINGALDAIKSDLNYSKFINLLNKSGLELNRKMISEIAIADLEAFKTIVDRVQNTPTTVATKSAKIEKVETVKAKEVKSEAKATAKEAKPKLQTLVDVKSDDLKIVEGIGPAIEKILIEAGISTYAQLASTEVTAIEQILTEAGPRFSIHKPTTWPTQAELARDGKFEELEVLKKELDGGK